MPTNLNIVLYYDVAQEQQWPLRYKIGIKIFEKTKVSVITQYCTNFIYLLNMLQSDRSSQHANYTIL